MYSKRAFELCLTLQPVTCLSNDSPRSLYLIRTSKAYGPCQVITMCHLGCFQVKPQRLRNKEGRILCCSIMFSHIFQSDRVGSIFSSPPTSPLIPLNGPMRHWICVFGRKASLYCQFKVRACGLTAVTT